MALEDIFENTSGGVAAFTTSGPGGNPGPIRVGKKEQQAKKKTRLKEPGLLSCYVTGYDARCRKK